MLAYMHAQYSFFHQGFNLLKEVEPKMRALGKQVKNLTSHLRGNFKNENIHKLMMVNVTARRAFGVIYC